MLCGLSATRGEFFHLHIGAKELPLKVGKLWVDGSSLKLMEHNMTFLKHKHIGNI